MQSQTRAPREQRGLQGVGRNRNGPILVVRAKRSADMSTTNK